MINRFPIELGMTVHSVMAGTSANSSADALLLLFNPLQQSIPLLTLNQQNECVFLI